MRYAIANGILYQELPGEAVVLNLTTAEYYHLNSVGHAAWELIRCGEDHRTIEDTLAREFEASREQIQSDLDAFLKRMIELKLIVPNESCEVGPG
jgi:hypothetical protein